MGDALQVATRTETWVSQELRIEWLRTNHEDMSGHYTIGEFEVARRMLGLVPRDTPVETVLG